MSFTFLGQNASAANKEVESSDQPKSFTFLGQEPEEGYFKNLVRTGLQLPLGLAKKVTARADIASGVAQGAVRAQASEENDIGRAIAEHYFPEQKQGRFTPEEINQQAANVANYFPTQGNVEEFVENTTGLPLRPKTELQKALRFGTEIASFKPGSVGAKTGAGAAGATSREALIQMGVPEWAADLVAGYIALRPQNPKALKPEVQIGEAPPVQKQLPAPETMIDVSPIRSEFEAGQAIQKHVGKKPPPPPPVPPAPFVLPKAPKAPEKPITLEKPTKPIQEQVQDPTFLEKLTPATLPAATAPISKKVTEINEPLGIRIRRPEVKLSPEDEVKAIFSNTKTENATKGGVDTKKVLNAQDQELYKKVSKEYKRSEDANSRIQAIHPEYAQFLQRSIQEIEAIDHPSGVQNKLKKAMEDILDGVAIVDENGRISGYKPKNNQDLIRQKQSLGQVVDFDFAHGNPYNIFKPLIAETNKAILQAAAQDPKALASLERANKLYSEWADLYSNDYMKPWRDSTNHDYTKLYNAAKNIDEFNQLKKVLKQSKEGRQLLKQLQADLIESKMMPFFEKGDAQGFQRQLAELKPIITPQQDRLLRNQFYRQSNLRSKKITNLAQQKQKQKEEIEARNKAKIETHKRQLEAHEKKTRQIKIEHEKKQAEHKEKITKHKEEIEKGKAKAKSEKEVFERELKDYEESQKGRHEILDSVPEKVAKKLNTVSGVKELREALSDTKEGKELFDRVANYKAADILWSKKVPPGKEGEHITSLLHDKENVALLKELLGPESVQRLIEIFENVDVAQRTFRELAKANPALSKHEQVFNWLYDIMTFTKSPHKWAKALKYIAKNPLWIRNLGRTLKNLAKEGIVKTEAKVNKIGSRINQGYTKEELAEIGKKYEAQLKNLSSHLSNYIENS